MHTFTSTYADKYKQTQAYRHSGAYTCMYTGAHIYINKYTRVQAFILTQAHPHIQADMGIHSYTIHACAYTYMYTGMQQYSHAYTWANAQPPVAVFGDWRCVCNPFDLLMRAHIERLLQARLGTAAFHEVN